MFCPNCGNQNDDNNKFCWKCGESLQDDVPVEEQETHGRRKKKFIRALFVCIPVVALICLVFFVLTNKGFIVSNDQSDKDSDSLVKEVDDSPTDLHMLEVDEMGYKASNSDEVIELLTDMSSALKLENASEDLDLNYEHQVGDSTYYRYAQKYQGIPVYGKSVVVATSLDDTVELISDNVLHINDIDTNPSLSEDEAISAACDYYEVEENDITETALYIYDDDKGSVHLAYVVKFGFLDAIIDAHSGELIDEINHIKYETAELKGQGGQRRKVEINKEDDEYILFDEIRNIYVNKVKNEDKVELVNKTWPFKLYRIKKGSTPIRFKTPEKLNEESAVDALFNIEKAYDFYLNVCKYKSTDGTGKASINIIDGIEYYESSDDPHDSFYNNAGSLSDLDAMNTDIWIGQKKGKNLTYAKDLDVLAHEYTHAVIAFTCNLSDLPESAALNEGISDIMGEMADIWDKGDPNWQMSDVRNLVTPEEPGLNSYDQFTNDTECHAGSTIVSHAAYLMWSKEKNKQYEAINSYVTMSELWMRTIHLLNSNATFADCRKCCECAANQMNRLGVLTDKQVATVGWAFDQVGVKAVSANANYYEGKPIKIRVYDYSDQLTDQFKVTVRKADDEKIL